MCLYTVDPLYDLVNAAVGIYIYIYMNARTDHVLQVSDGHIEQDTVRITLLQCLYYIR